MINNSSFPDDLLDKPLYDKVSRREWIEELEGQNYHNRKHLFAIFARWGTPPSMLDVGCGTGIMVDTARQLGIEAYGIDQLIDPDNESEYLFHHNLMAPFSLQSKTKRSMCDLVLCLEVAEHVHADAHDVLCDTLANNLSRNTNSLLVFSSAQPGQGGINHESERNAKYWRDKFAERGLNFRHDYSVELALFWSRIQSPLYWLAANVQVFEK